MNKTAMFLMCANVLVWSPGCRNAERQAALHTRQAVLKVSSLSEAAPPAPLPLEPKPRPDLLVASLRKRVLGRENSQRDIYRVARNIDPIIVEAANQASVQEALQRLASDQGVPVAKMKQSWVSMQDADILLESGGDPDAISSAGAVGAAQWMPGSGAKAGLVVHAEAARQVTPQITELQRQIAWLQYLRQPNPNLAAPGLPTIPADQLEPRLGALLKQLDVLKAKRAALDERYDARKSIFAQTRYLLGISWAYPSPSWLFQAYHGGEGGVTRTLKEWYGPKWPGSVRAAIIPSATDSGSEGNAAAGQLTFESLYFGATPTNHAQAFRYLYGRGDDHRHYWWKLRVAQEALDLYARNTSESASDCMALLPGCPAPMVWYGKDHPSLLTLDDVTALTAVHELVHVSPSADLTPVKTPDDPIHAESYAVLRPSAWGALNLIMHAYKASGGTSAVRLLDLTRTIELNSMRERRLAALPAVPSKPEPVKPLWPPKPNPVHDQFDFHTVGIEFDIERPAAAEDRKIMDYCIGYFEDRGIIVRTLSKGEDAWQIVPNPKYAKALSHIAQTGKLPELAGL